MSKELVISSSRHETRVAILEDDQLVEIYFQRANEYSLAGSIHKGRVTRVLPGMQSAFVDLGLERDTFLYVSDFFEENGEEYDRIETKPPNRRRGTRPARNPITDHAPYRSAAACSFRRIREELRAAPDPKRGRAGRRAPVQPRPEARISGTDEAAVAGAAGPEGAGFPIRSMPPT